MNCHVYHPPSRSGFKINVRHNRGATITGFDSKLVKSLGLIFQKNEMFGKACPQVIQPSGNTTADFVNFCF